MIGRVTNPPTTTIARGFSISAPVPEEIMNGIKLMLPIRALNNSARRRKLAPANLSGEAHMLYAVLFEGREPQQAVHQLLTREPRAE